MGKCESCRYLNKSKETMVPLVTCTLIEMGKVRGRFWTVDGCEHYIETESAVEARIVSKGW